jgi:LysM domain
MKLPRRSPDPRSLRALGCTLALALGPACGPGHANPHYPVTESQRGTARQVAEAGVPLSELAANAPESHTVRPGDTLWDIAKLFLRNPWRWPELWGMNLQEIANPHLIYPGQHLVLTSSNGRARLQLARGAGGTVRLSPQIRSTRDLSTPIPSIPAHLLQPFLNDAIILDDNELANAPAIISGREGRVLLGRGDTAYVRGDIGNRRDWRVFRAPKPLTDPETGAVLGYEGVFVGAAELVQNGTTRQLDDKQVEIEPSTIRLTRLRQEAGQGDRLAAAHLLDYGSFVPRAPAQAVSGQVVSVYGGGVNAGQYQIIAINRGRAEGLERGHVLGLYRRGEQLRDPVNVDRALLKLPDEHHGHMLVFRVFEHVAYALIMSAQHPVSRGDRFTQP